MLLDGGAQFVHYLLDNVNYFIADNPDHPKVSEACEIYEKPVVTVSLLQSDFISWSLIIFINHFHQIQSRWVWLCAKTSTILPYTFSFLLLIRCNFCLFSIIESQGFCHSGINCFQISPFVRPTSVDQMCSRFGRWLHFMEGNFSWNLTQNALIWYQ